MPFSRRRVRAFTLIELLMVMAIVAVLMALAAPSYGRLIGRSHVRTASSELAVSLNEARFAAAMRRAHVVACPSEDRSHCDRTTQWHHGWILFEDSNRDRDHSADEPVIGVSQAQRPGIAIVSTIGRMQIDYQPDGSAGGSNLTLTACDRMADAGAATSLIINNAGRVRSAPAAPDAAAACLHVAQ